MYVFLMLSVSPKIISKGLLQCDPLHWQELSGFHVVVLHWQKNWFDECFVLPSMDKSLCCHTRIRWVFSPCFIYLFIYFYVGHLIIDGGYPCMIETSETVDVVALKNPCSHLNLCPHSFHFEIPRYCLQSELAKG